jgi:hypothetical protein
MTSAEAQTLLPAFLDFVKTLKGDEKSEAQTFLDRLFKALGHAGAQEAGATFEYRVAKKPGSSQLSLFSGMISPTRRSSRVASSSPISSGPPASSSR